MEDTTPGVNNFESHFHNLIHSNSNLESEAFPCSGGLSWDFTACFWCKTSRNGWSLPSKGQFKNIKRHTPDGRTINETFGTNIPIIGESTKAVEDLNFRFMTIKSTFGAGFKKGNFAVGAGFDLVYGFMELKRTYQDETRSLTIPGGIRYQSDSAYSMGGKIGVSYDLTENIRIAYSYTTRNFLPMDGTMKVDSYAPERSFGTRVLRYMIWPDKHIAGISYRTDRFIIDFPWNLKNWVSELMKSLTKLQPKFAKNKRSIRYSKKWMSSHVTVMLAMLVTKLNSNQKKNNLT